MSVEPVLPPKPEPPDPGDCCGGGACSPCVYDAYEAALKVWRERVAQLQAQLPPETRP